jgi:hypothetical protein
MANSSIRTHSLAPLEMKMFSGSAGNPLWLSMKLATSFRM